VVEADRLGVAGLCATAVTFGPARYAYGLFLPVFREEFALSTTILGFIASGLYAGYLIALSAVGLLATRVGPRLPVTIGIISAGLGMALVALAPNSIVLAVGVVLAGTGAGWTWAPFNDATEQIPTRSRDRVLSVVSTGTTFGILAAGVLALVTGDNWRAAWTAFAVAAGAAVVPSLVMLPDASDRGSQDRVGWRWMLRTEAVPLAVVASSFGVVSAFYFSFAVDAVADAGELSRAMVGGVLYAVIGAAGLVGLLTGAGVARLGLGPVLTAALACLGLASLLMGVAAGVLPAVIVSAALFGAGVMVMSALLSIWSSAVFPDHPSAGFSAALFVFGVGLVAGPAVLGALAGAYGLRWSFLVAAAFVLLTMAARPRHGGRPRPEPTS
jgi:MFS family permease